MRRIVCFLLLGSLAAAGCSSDGDSTPMPPTEWPPNATVYFNQYGIFTADCQTDEDCTMALGYYHARDRFVQMDLRRRFPTGRLTDVVNKELVELAGDLEALVDTAAANRALFSTPDGRPGEEAALESATPKTMALLTAYAAGVNQWISDVQSGRNGAQWPAEFQSGFLDYAPEDVPEWTPADSIATVLALVESLTNDDQQQIRAGAAFNSMPIERFLDLWSNEPIAKSPVLEEGTYPPSNSASLTPKRVEPDARPDVGLLRRAQPVLQRLDARLAATEGLRRMVLGQDPINSDIGSNNWVIGPSISESGNTLLSNDPHLGLSQPSVWYIAHMDAKTNGSGTMHTAGVTFAGLPWVIIGQNEDIAWGATNTGLDMSDVYVEELVKDSGGSATGVMFDGEAVDFVRVDATFEFNDGTTDSRELLFVPHHGPVRAKIESGDDTTITLRWTGNQVTTDVNFLSNVGAATSVEEARTAFRDVTTIGQCWVAIDNEGNFGWFPYNRVPKRTWAVDLDLMDPSEPFPWLPLDGSSGDYEWEEYFTPEELPQAFNRENGYIATANSEFTGAAFDGNPTNNGHAPLQTDNIAAGYRHKRIAEVLEAEDQHNTDTMQALVSDVNSMIGREMLPKILEIANDEMTTLSEDAQQVVDVLTAWQSGDLAHECPTGLEGNDPVMSPLTTDMSVLEASAGCSTWHATIRAIDRALARDESNKSFPAFVTYMSIMDPTRLTAGDVYWDDVRTDGVEEDKHDIIEIALDEAAAELQNLFATSDDAEWAWGRIHGFVLQTDLSSLSSLFSGYNNPPGDDGLFFANRGGLETVDVANPGGGGDYIHGSGPSTRFVCEGLPEGVSCAIQLPGGQSGHVDNSNYDDLLELWLGREPVDLVFDVSQAAEEAVETISLGN